MLEPSMELGDSAACTDRSPVKHLVLAPSQRRIEVWKSPVLGLPAQETTDFQPRTNLRQQRRINQRRPVLLGQIAQFHQAEEGRRIDTGDDSEVEDDIAGPMTGRRFYVVPDPLKYPLGRAK